jgi:glycosyltransferase involved in cell wall biosynthesis
LAKEQRYAYTRADHLITISEDMKDTLVNDGVNEDKISVIYNWSYQDELYMNVDTSPVSNMFSKEFFNVVYAGNVGMMQNVDILIEAAKLMKEDKSVWFHIIGNGVYKEKLEAKAREYGINNISFWPMQKPELAPVIYSAADVNVIPLVKNIYRTALPSKTATCLACGKPIFFAVGKESAFAQKAVKETGCLLVDADNPAELADSLRAACLSELKCNNLDFFRKYCEKTSNSKLYAEIITAIGG